MKVLVTGGCGFLGSHICEMFKDKGWEVIVYDNMTKFETSRIQFGDNEAIRNYNYEYLLKLGVKVFPYDIRHNDALEYELDDCDYIINCASQPTMTLSSKHPNEDFSVNVLGTFNMLELARKFNIPFANCSSIHVYGTGINEELSEGEESYIRTPPTIGERYPVMTGRLTPLHASKRCAEIYLQTYIDTYGIKAVNFRLTGIYGERQFGSEDHGWVSLLAIKAMLGLPIQIIGTGKQVRDILYVKDASEAFYKWYERPIPGTYNIGGGMKTKISVIQCLQRLYSIFGTEQNISYGGERRGDLRYFVCDTAKAYGKFGWYPKTNYVEGLERLTDWLKKEQVNIFA